MPTHPALPADLVSSVEALRADLTGVFGTRLRAIVAYGPRLFPGPAGSPPERRRPLNTLAVVDALSFDDLQACALRRDAWRQGGLSMPLLLGQDDFVRSLDVFPFEYGDIVARHHLVFGADPFEGLAPRADDLRRACEAQGKSHLIHLREGFLEAGGRAPEVAALVAASAAPFAALLGHVARLRGQDDSAADALVRAVDDLPGVSRAAVHDVLALVNGPDAAFDDARRLYPEYLRTTEAIVAFLDGWTHQPAGA